MMLLIRSIGIVDAVCSTGIVAAGLQPLLGGAGPAVDEVLADQRLRAGLAEGVGAQRAEAVLGDREVDQRALGAAVDAHAGDVAGADAGDLDVGALDDAERVVELDRVGPVLRVLRAGAGRRDDGGGAGGEQQGDDEQAAHLVARERLARVAVEVRRRLPGPRAVLGLVVAAARAAVALVGRRGGLEGLVAQLRRDGRELALEQGEGARVDADARGAAERVVGAGVAEVVEPAEQVDRVGPDVADLRRGVLERLGRGGEGAGAVLAVLVDVLDGDVAQRDLERW